MQTQPEISQMNQTNTPPKYAVTLATIAAVLSILAVPFALIPILGLSGSVLVLGFVTALAIWTRRKRAFIGIGVACLAGLIGAVSSAACVATLIHSREVANARVAQVQSQLEAMKAQASNSSDRKIWTDLIKTLGGNDVTDNEANLWGGLLDLGVRAWADSNKSEQATDK